MLQQMDRSWVNGRQFTPAYIHGVEQFMEFVRQRYPEQTQILCPCRRCLNQTLRPQAEVHDHIHISGMSSTYTRWIHHGESLAADIVEPSDLHECHHDDWITVDEEDDDDDNRVPDVDLVGELYKAAE